MAADVNAEPVSTGCKVPGCVFTNGVNVKDGVYEKVCTPESYAVPAVPAVVGTGAEGKTEPSYVIVVRILIVAFMYELGTIAEVPPGV